MPRILITGASGFIGQLLTTKLLSDPNNQLVLTDLHTPVLPPKCPNPSNATSIAADLSSPNSLSTLLSAAGALDAVYIFHGIMSSGSEADFSLGLRVNLHATLSLLEALRTSPHNQPQPQSQSASKLLRIIFASSQAVYGPPLPLLITEADQPTPSSSYGAQKLMIETLLNDYTRKGYFDGLVLRFPTVTVRPGKPTQAASSWISGMIREPLKGQECVIPLKDRAFRSWICSPRSLGENLVHALTVDLGRVEKHHRVVNVPGTGVTVQEMLDVLRKVGGEQAVALVREERDEVQEGILRSWGTDFDNEKAFVLGFGRDGGFEAAVREYVEGLKEGE